MTFILNDKLNVTRPNVFGVIDEDSLILRKCNLLLFYPNKQDGEYPIHGFDDFVILSLFVGVMFDEKWKILLSRTSSGQFL